MYITYTVNAPRDGLYFLTLKYRQNTEIGMSVLRNIYINGEIPYKELSSVSFPYSSGWRNKTVSDENGALPADASTDGVHLNKAYCQKWLAYLKNHTVEGIGQ